jgi:hypothetical protein
MINHARAHRILLNVSHHRQKIFIIADYRAFKPARPNVPGTIVLEMIIPRMRYRDRFHYRADPALLRRLQQKVDMIAHQTIRENLKSKFRFIPSENFEIFMIIGFFGKNYLPVVTPIDDVID